MVLTLICLTITVSPLADVYSRRIAVYNPALPGAAGVTGFRQRRLYEEYGFDLGIGYRANITSDIKIQI